MWAFFLPVRWLDQSISMTQWQLAHRLAYEIWYRTRHRKIIRMYQIIFWDTPNWRIKKKSTSKRIGDIPYFLKPGLCTTQIIRKHTVSKHWKTVYRKKWTDTVVETAFPRSRGMILSRGREVGVGGHWERENENRNVSISEVSLHDSSSSLYITFERLC